jgi:hypothetical protein
MKRIWVFLLLGSTALADVPVPPAASQTEVNAGVIHSKYVAPDTLYGYTGGPGMRAQVATDASMTGTAAATNDSRSLVLTNPANQFGGTFIGNASGGTNLANSVPAGGTTNLLANIGGNGATVGVPLENLPSYRPPFSTNLMVGQLVLPAGLTATYVTNADGTVTTTIVNGSVVTNNSPTAYVLNGGGITNLNAATGLTGAITNASNLASNSATAGSFLTTMDGYSTRWTHALAWNGTWLYLSNSVNGQLAIADTPTGFVFSNTFGGSVAFWPSNTSQAPTFNGSNMLTSASPLNAAQLTGTIPVGLLTTSGTNLVGGVLTTDGLGNREYTNALSLAGLTLTNGGFVIVLTPTGTNFMIQTVSTNSTGVLWTNTFMLGNNLSGNIFRIQNTNGADVLKITQDGTVTVNGGGLTNLNASSLASGTVPLAQLTAGVITNNSTISNLDFFASGVLISNAATRQSILFNSGSFTLADPVNNNANISCPVLFVGANTLQSSGIFLKSTANMGWSPNTDSSVARDAYFARNSTGTVDVHTNLNILGSITVGSGLIGRTNTWSGYVTSSLSADTNITVYRIEWQTNGNGGVDIGPVGMRSNTDGTISYRGPNNLWIFGATP